MSLSQSDVLTYCERFLFVLRNYFTGALEAGTWLCNDGENYYRSSRTAKLKIDTRGWISSQVEDACDLLDAGHFHEAGLRLIYLCDSAQALVRHEAFSLIPESIILTLEHVQRHPMAIRKVLQHFRDMSFVYHGAGHPLTCILTPIANFPGSDHGGSCQILHSAMSAIINSVSNCLGPLHMQSVALQIDYLECGEVSASYLRDILNTSDREIGISSHTSIECLRAMAYNMIAKHEHFEDALSIGNEIFERAGKACDPRIRDLGLQTALSVHIDTSMRDRRYDQAELGIQQSLINVNAFDTPDSLHNIALLSRLEHCLGQLGRHYEASVTKSRRLMLLPANDNLLLPD